MLASCDHAVASRAAVPSAAGIRWNRARGSWPHASGGSSTPAPAAIRRRRPAGSIGAGSVSALAAPRPRLRGLVRRSTVRHGDCGIVGQPMAVW